MVKLSVGDVVFVNFPFSNLTQSKLRPAVIIASVKNNDWILCQITSKAYSDSSSLKIESDSFEQGSLNESTGSVTKFYSPLLKLSLLLFLSLTPKPTKPMTPIQLN